MNIQCFQVLNLRAESSLSHTENIFFLYMYMYGVTRYISIYFFINNVLNVSCTNNMPTIIMVMVLIDMTRQKYNERPICCKLLLMVAYVGKRAISLYM